MGYGMEWAWAGFGWSAGVAGDAGLHVAAETYAPKYRYLHTEGIC